MIELNSETNAEIRGSTTVVVTSIASPNEALRSLANGCAERGMAFLVIGDKKSPTEYNLPGCSFYGIQKQEQLPFKLATALPLNHYSRKNLGYLLAISAGTQLIVETDDDNHPIGDFWTPKTLEHNCPVLEESGWVNVYRYFSRDLVWPRGFPLDRVRQHPPKLLDIPPRQIECPIQQGLADGNPDVDAVFRLLFELPVSFATCRLALGRNSWCPFNSQNTAWFPPAFPLMYLPSHCSFRMTDIWRSFIAQRVCWENGWGILFHEPTVRQLRNTHNLMTDFRDEISGYLENEKIATVLTSLRLPAGIGMVGEALRICYEALVTAKIFPAAELTLVRAWVEDVRQCCTNNFQRPD